MIEMLTSPWVDAFESLVRRAESSLTICSPYIAREPCKKLLDLLPGDDDDRRVSILVVTDLSRDAVLSGATDIRAVCDLSREHKPLRLSFLPSVHAKVYVADTRAAIVTSGNMTWGGLCRNFEYGIHVTEQSQVQRIRRDVKQYANLGSNIGHERLAFLAELARELGEIRREADNEARQRVRREYDRRFAKFETEVIRARAAGRTPHAIFADAIMYLLRRRGPMRTVELHPLIQAIHPDLCDDSVDRVIDGEHFGKKWKHAVRTAQQHLKRAGKIELVDGRWRLAEG
ncbi:MAG: phospholipase D-like domain-containing protein [Candidatus Brocadiia bacterium]